MNSKDTEKTKTNGEVDAGHHSDTKRRNQLPTLTSDDVSGGDE